MFKIIIVCLATILTFSISMISIASDSVTQNPKGVQSPAMYVSPGGTGTINYDVSQQALKNLNAEIKQSLFEVRQSFLNCMDTVKAFQDKKIEELNIKLAEYLTKEKDITKKTAKTWGKEILESSSTYKEFEDDNKKREDLLQEYNSQLSKNVIANSYRLFAFIFETVDLKINDMIQLNQNIKYEKSDSLNLFQKSTEKFKPFIARKVLFPKGTIIVTVSPGQINEKALVNSSPSTFFKVIGGNADLPSFKIEPKYAGAAGMIILGGGDGVKYKKMEITYPYKDMKYTPSSQNLLNEEFKNKFIENFTNFMKFAWSVCTEK